MEGPKIANLVNEEISALIPFGALILCASLLIIILLSRGLERWLFRWAYGEVWEILRCGESESRRSSFTCLHVSVIITFILLLAGIYPSFNFLVGSGVFSTTTSAGITIGDLLFVLSHIYCAYYLFDLCYYIRFINPPVIFHHVILLVMVQTALSRFANVLGHPEATLQYYLCMVWGKAHSQYVYNVETNTEPFTT